VVNSILCSELETSVEIENLNADVISDQAAFLILLSSWASDLGYDLLNTMENMSLSDYGRNLRLRSVRLCVCGTCPGTGSLTYLNCGPYIERELTQPEKLSFLKSISNECSESMRTVELINESFYDGRAAMLSLTTLSDYRGIVRLNACGCESCDGFDVFLELGETTHVTKEPKGIWLTRLTAENCGIPFSTDYQWLDVFQNVIVLDANHELGKHKTELPLYSKSLRMILDECEVSPADFQKVMANTKCFKKMNKKYGMRKMLKLVITYNLWAKIQDLPRIKTFIYNDKRLFKQASEFLFLNGLDKPIQEEAGDRRALVSDIRSASLNIGTIEVPLPVKQEPKVKEIVFSEVFTQMMEELDENDPFECLEKKNPGLKDHYMRTICDNVERLPLEMEQYLEKAKRERALINTRIHDNNVLDLKYNLKMVNEFTHLTMHQMDNKKEIDRFLKDYPEIGTVNNAAAISKELSMKVLPNSSFSHEDLAECDNPPEIKPLKKHELQRFNNWENVESAYKRKGVKIGLKPIHGITTAEEYANEIVKNTSIPLEDALEIYSWNEIIIKERQHRAPKPTVAGSGTCKVYKERIKRHQLEIPFRVYSELKLNKGHIKQEKFRINVIYEEDKREFLRKALGKPMDPRDEMEFEKPPEINNKLVSTDRHVEMEKALIPNKGLVLNNKFTKFVRQKFRELYNPYLKLYNYQINADYRVEKIGYSIENKEFIIRELKEIINGFGPYSNFNYDRIMAMYIEEHGGEANPLSNLYDRCVKHFNQTLLKTIRNRRNFSRMILLSNDDKAKLVVGLACKEYGLIKTVKDQKKLRATEIRKICSKFFRHECFG
jgi:hypothetical protein